MAKMTYQELLSLYTQIHTQVKQARTVIGGVKTNVTALVSTSSITGKAADAAKAYLKEVHSGGILKSLDTILENYDQRFCIYVKNYSAVDADQNLELRDETLASVKDVMQSKKGNYEVFLDELTAIMSSVNYICSTSGSTSVSQANTQTDTVFSNAQQVTDNLQTQWHNYEKRHASAPDDALNLLSQTRSLMLHYRSEKTPRMGDYTVGSFRQLAGEDFFKGLDNLAAYNKSHKSMAEEANKYIDDLSGTTGLEDFIKSLHGILSPNEITNLLRLLKSNPEKAIEKLWSSSTLLKAMESDTMAEEIFFKLAIAIDSLNGAPAKIMDALFDSKGFQWAISYLPKYQEGILNAMIGMGENGIPVVNKVGKIADWAKALSSGRISTILTKVTQSTAGKILGKVGGVLPWALLATKVSFSAYDEYNNKESDAYHDLGKSIVGGIIEGVFYVGPIDGMIMGGQIGTAVGGPPGGAVGTAMGGLFGATNWVVDAFCPEFHDKVKTEAYAFIDLNRKATKRIIKNSDELIHNLREISPQHRFGW